jgi:hypothetical protein
MDAVSTFGDVEDPWNIQFRKSLYGFELIRSLPNAAVEPRFFTPFQASLTLRLSRGVRTDPAWLRGGLAASLRSVAWHGKLPAAISAPNRRRLNGGVRAGNS